MAKKTTTSAKVGTFKDDTVSSNINKIKNLGTQMAAQIRQAIENQNKQPSATDKINSMYDSNIQSMIDALNSAAKNSTDQQNATSDAALKNAYISYMTGKKSLADNLAKQGITGGGSETSNLRSESNYQNNRGTIESDRASAINKINQQLQSDIADKTYEMNNARATALQTQWQNDITNAQNAQKIKDDEKNDKVSNANTAANTAATYQNTKDAKATAYQNEISGYTAHTAAHKIHQIEAWKKTDPKKYAANQWKINYLRSRYGEATAEEKTLNHNLSK